MRTWQQTVAHHAPGRDACNLEATAKFRIPYDSLAHDATRIAKSYGDTQKYGVKRLYTERFFVCV